MSFFPTPSTVSRDLASLLGDRHGPAVDPLRGIAILAALGGYLANTLIAHASSGKWTLMLHREIRDPQAEETVNALIRAIDRASHGSTEVVALQAWAIGACGERKPGPQGNRLSFRDGRRRLVRRLRRLVATAERNANPRTTYVLRGLASSARILGAMGWIQAPIGPLLGLTFEALADGGDERLLGLRPSLGLTPAVVR